MAYDARCGPCSKFKAAVDFLDVRNLLEFMSLDVAESSGLMAGIDRSARYSSFHLVDPSSGVARSGSEALLPLAGLLSPWRAIPSLLEGAPWGARALSFGYSVLSRLHRACPTDLGRGDAVRN